MADSTHKIIPSLNEALIVIKSLEAQLAAEHTANRNLRESLEKANKKIGHLINEREAQNSYLSTTKNMMRKAMR